MRSKKSFSPNFHFVSIGYPPEETEGGFKLTSAGSINQAKAYIKFDIFSKTQQNLDQLISKPLKRWPYFQPQFRYFFIGVPGQNKMKAGVKVWWRERDSNPRCPFRNIHDFQSCSFNRSDTSPIPHAHFIPHGDPT